MPEKRLIGQPCLLLGRPQHTHAGSSLGPRVRQTGFQQCLAVTLAPVLPLRPQAINIEVIFPQNGHPRPFQRRIFHEHRRPAFQLSEDVPFLQPFRQPLPLGFHAGMSFFHADNAAQRFIRQIFRGQINKHTKSSQRTLWEDYSTTAVVQQERSGIRVMRSVVQP